MPCISYTQLVRLPWDFRPTVSEYVFCALSKWSGHLWFSQEDLKPNEVILKLPQTTNSKLVMSFPKKGETATQDLTRAKSI